jgi:hypothetical protein
MRYFPSNDLDGERLMKTWLWLCHETTTLTARNVYGDLFLTNPAGVIYRLDIGDGTLTAIADSKSAFEELLVDKGNEWFPEQTVNGVMPDSAHCIGFKIPVVFEQSADVQQNAYVADLYEYVAFMGNLHQQLADVPDGGKVRIVLKSRPSLGAN